MSHKIKLSSYILHMFQFLNKCWFELKNSSVFLLNYIWFSIGQFQSDSVFIITAIIINIIINFNIFWSLEVTSRYYWLLIWMIINFIYSFRQLVKRWTFILYQFFFKLLWLKLFLCLVFFICFGMEEFFTLIIH